MHSKFVINLLNIMTALYTTYAVREHLSENLLGNLSENVLEISVYRMR